MNQLKSFEYVISISENGGISQAAERLGLTQPALSRYISKLEADLGIELFDRSTTPMKLTQAGELYASTGKELLQKEQLLKRQIDSLKKNEQSIIKFGISPSRASFLMPSFIEDFTKKIKDCRVIVEELRIDELKNKLITGSLDLMISIEDDETSRLDKIPLYTESFVLAVPKVLDFDGTITEKINKNILISLSDSPFVSAVVNRLLQNSKKKSIDIECNSFEVGLSMIKKNIGVMVVPSYVKKYGSSELNDSISFYDLELKTSEIRNVCLFFRKGQLLSNNEKKLIDSIRKESV